MKIEPGSSLESELHLYEKGEASGTWAEGQIKEDPKYPDRVFDVLESEGIISPENLDSFVLWGPAANNAWIETELARKLDAYVEKHNLKPKQKPLIYASDFTDQSAKLDRPPDLNNVAFAYGKHEASANPIPDEEINIIYDRLGATWYFASRGEKEDVINLLKFYASKLADSGVIVLDAHTLESAERTNLEGTSNTAFYLQDIFRENYFGVDNNLNDLLESIGLERDGEGYIGEGKDRLMVLKKVSSKEETQEKIQEDPKLARWALDALSKIFKVK